MAATLGSGERWTQGTRSRTGGWDKVAFRRNQGCGSSKLKVGILGQMEAYGKMLSLGRVRVAVEDGPGQTEAGNTSSGGGCAPELSHQLRLVASGPPTLSRSCPVQSPGLLD